MELNIIEIYICQAYRFLVLPNLILQSFWGLWPTVALQFGCLDTWLCRFAKLLEYSSQDIGQDILAIAAVDVVAAADRLTRFMGPLCVCCCSHFVLQRLGSGNYTHWILSGCFVGGSVIKSRNLLLGKSLNFICHPASKRQRHCN